MQFYIGSCVLGNTQCLPTKLSDKFLKVNNLSKSGSGYDSQMFQLRMWLMSGILMYDITQRRVRFLGNCCVSSRQADIENIVIVICIMRAVHIKRNYAFKICNLLLVRRFHP